MNSHSKRYDTIVIGAGPAGSSAAIFLRRQGQSVLILEKSIFPRDKVCGEFISPRAWKIFEELGIGERLRESGYHPVREAVLYSSSGKAIEIKFQPEHGLALSRAKLDHLLLRHAQSLGVEVEEGVLVSHREKTLDSWLVRSVVKGSQTLQTLEAKRVILASGRPRQPDSKKQKHRMFGVKAHYDLLQNLNETLELYFLDVGYGGLVEIEDEKVNVCFLLDMNRVPVDLIPKRPDDFMQWVFDRHPILKEKMKNAVRINPLLTTPPLPLGLKMEEHQENEICIGDALGVIDPFFGEGITLALEAGWLLSQSSQDRAFYRAIHKNFKTRFLLGRTMRFFSFHPYLLNGLSWCLSKMGPIPQVLFRLAHRY
ncbi:MAG: NAD(P)/FAD-dependent oxidoreductase [Chlamydiae bacterium]|nr:NAD(P)/FAD-dependent oxidoreductase [Chlamydiota bacterium]MBI3276391.1 NAD(P)/FAD-dependent oxidoreductase [Chlamydiota bacterium]